MRTTIALDDNLIRTAQEYTGLTEKSALMREALKALIEEGFEATTIPAVAKRAGIGRRVFPHLLRHSLATNPT